MITTIDFAILDWIAANLRSGFLDVVMPLITMLCEAGALWILLGLVLVCRKRTRRLGLMILLGLVLNLILCNLILKPLVARPRPFAQREVELLIPMPRDYSFPSGHTSASFAAVMPLLLEKQRGRFAALALAVLIALSRLYLYVHFPTDVMVGGILGAFCGLAAVLILRKCMKNHPNMKPDEE